MQQNFCYAASWNNYFWFKESTGNLKQEPDPKFSGLHNHFQVFSRKPTKRISDV